MSPTFHADTISRRESGLRRISATTLRDLVDVAAVGRRPAAPLVAVDRAELAVGVGPLVPDRHAGRLQRAHVGLAAQEPEQLVDDRLGVHLLGRHQREPGARGRSASGSRTPTACRCRCGRPCAWPWSRTWRMKSRYWRIGRRGGRRARRRRVLAATACSAAGAGDSSAGLPCRRAGRSCALRSPSRERRGRGRMHCTRTSSTSCGERRFAPFFWTQFLGAGNDNVYKNALVIFVAFQAATHDDARPERARQPRRRRVHRAVRAALGDGGPARRQVREVAAHPLDQAVRDRDHGRSASPASGSATSRCCSSRSR